MTKIIGIVQVKGGAGRSTLATNLAGELAKIGRTVLIDGDMPQGTSASWAAVRLQAELEGELIADTAADHRELVGKVQEHAKNAAYVVLDGPPRLAEMSRAILMLADLSLVPVGASMAEIWAMSDVLSLVEEAKTRRAVDVRGVWTRHRAQTSLTRDISQSAKKELGLTMLKSTLCLRVAYPRALGDGKTVAEVGDSTARDELAKLVAEVRKVIK